MSSQFLGDLNDFISPSQACIKPVPSKEKTLIVSLDMADDSVVSSDPVTISLNDCLACSGCITSAESVLVSQQTYLQLYQVLDTNAEALRANVFKPKLVVVSVSPQSRISIASHFGLNAQDAAERISVFLKRLGVDYVFDTNFGRDIALFEGSLEFLQHYKESKDTNKASPLICSSCPGWVCYAEKTQPQMIEHLSRVKSPQQIMGTLVKYFFAPRILASSSLSPSHIFHVAVMPCYDKKLEASRPDFFDETFETRDVDCVISTSELLKIIEEKEFSGNDFVIDKIPNIIDCQLSLLSPAGILQSHGGSGSGGYLENILRFASKKLFNVDLRFDSSGQLELAPSMIELYELRVENQRNSDYQDFTLIAKASGEICLRFAKVYGFRNVQNLVRKFKNNRIQYDYVEVMACPGACLNGGGQIRPELTSGVTPKQNLERMKELYSQGTIMDPLVDPKIEAVYREWLGGYSSPLLRTNFRAVEKTLPTSNFSVQW